MFESAQLVWDVKTETPEVGVGGTCPPTKFCDTYAPIISRDILKKFNFRQMFTVFKVRDLSPTGDNISNNG